MISAGELAQLRRDCELTMTDRCQILRPVNTPDTGGMVTTFSVTGTVKCRVAPSSYQQQERVIGGALVASASWRVTLPAETDVDQVDLLSIGSSLAGAGLTMAQVVAGGGRLMEVLGTASPRTLEMQCVVFANELG